jgi:putative ABC transport system permease protein
MRELINRLRYLAGRRSFERELDAEVQFHIEARAEELAQGGMSLRVALAQARREFGPGASMREETRSAWQLQWLEDLVSDLRYAARAFRRNPIFAATAIACLALGIGANTTMFSIVNEALLSTPSCRDPRTLVHVMIGGNSHAPMREYRFVRDAGIFAGLGGENENYEANWSHGGGTDRLYVVQVTGNYFDVTGIPLAFGRPTRDEADTVVISHRFWQTRLGGDANVIGRKLVLDGAPYTVAGVLPRDHRTVVGFGFAPDLYMPISGGASVSGDKSIVAFYGRLPQDMTRQIAFQRLKSVCAELDRIYPDGGNHKWQWDITVNPVAGLKDDPFPLEAFAGFLMVITGLVLLIACANVASLLLARASSRTRELAVRLSIGASRGRLVRQLLAESLLLAFCGTGAGLLLNLALTSAVNRVRLPLPIPIQFLIQPDARLLVYAIAVALVCSLAAGLIPALKSTRGALGVALKREEHQVGRSRLTLRDALVVGQLAVSIVLLCAGFLFMRNLTKAGSMSPGFDVDRTVWADMRLVPQSYSDPAKIRLIAGAALERLRGLPGVDSAAGVRVVPLNDNWHSQSRLFLDGGAQPVQVRFMNNYVTDEYFQTMGIHLLQGREFLPTDNRQAPRVAVLNQNMAAALFGPANPLGHSIAFDRGKPIRIVGVAANSKYFTLGEQNVFAYYEPYAQWDGSIVNLHFLLRTALLPDTLVAPVDRALASLDPTAALETKPMSRALVLAMLPSRVGAILLGSMGLLGLLLASIGLYGTLLYAVSCRIREIGLRVALGATPAGILRLVIRQSVTLLALGLCIGIALAVYAVRPLAMFLIPDVRPTDAANFVVTAAVLSAVALVATVAPALRALRVDPMVALRHE